MHGWQVGANGGEVFVMAGDDTWHFSPAAARQLAGQLEKMAAWADSLAMSERAGLPERPDVAGQAEVLEAAGWQWCPNRTEGQGFWGRFTGEFMKSRTGPYAEVTQEAFAKSVERTGDPHAKFSR